MPEVAGEKDCGGLKQDHSCCCSHNLHKCGSQIKCHVLIFVINEDCVRPHQDEPVCEQPGDGVGAAGVVDVAGVVPRPAG